MKIEREALLKTLSTASVGLTKRDILEQSSAFVFDKDALVTFNGEIFTKVDNPLPDVQGAVPAGDFMAILSKFPDEEVEITTKKEEIILQGKRRKAGMTMIREIHLPYTDVPDAGKWGEMPPELFGTLLQAARVCGRDETKIIVTLVHVTPSVVEASDNCRLFRTTMKTGLDELLIPAVSIEAMGSLVFDKVSIKGGWVHFRSKAKHRVSIRCAKENYPDLTPILKLDSPKKVQLPGNLPDILARAQIMHETTYDSTVEITIKDGLLTLRSRKETGWYKEERKVDYSDTPLKFSVHPKFLEEILAKTRNVKIGGNRMKIEAGETVFIVGLEVANGKD